MEVSSLIGKCKFISYSLTFRHSFMSRGFSDKNRDYGRKEIENRDENIKGMM